MTRARTLADLGSQSLATDAEATAAASAAAAAVPTGAKNLLYNGAMQVAQRGTSATGLTTAGYYTLDRFRTIFDAAPGVWTQSQDTNTPDGFGSSLRMTCTTADSSLTGNEAMVIEQYLEGQDLQHLLYGTASAKSLTLSFWVRSNVTGTYVLNFRERDNNYLIARSYSIDASNTWEYKTITIPGLTLGSGMDNDNALSFSVHFWLVAGPNYASGTLQTSWGSYSTPDRAVGQTNLAAATNNYWQITGVQLEVGDTATEFEHLPYGVELARCQRYYQRIDGGTSVHVAPFIRWVSTQPNTWIPTRVNMRTSPSLEHPTGTDFYQWYSMGAVDKVSSLTLNYTSPLVVNVKADTTSRTAGSGGWLQIASTSAYLGFNAEL